MEINKILFSLVILSSFSLISCDKDKQINYPIEPHIVFKNIKITKGSDSMRNQIDAIRLTLDYTDGDSNLGRYSCDTCYSDYNCTATFYKKTNGIMNLIVGNNPIHILIPEMPKRPNFSYIMPMMTIKARTLYEGELQMTLSFFTFENQFIVGDTIKIAVQVIDNDNNKSNITGMEKIYLYE